ncbi:MULTISPECIES: class I SAM-dependent methyltransferase [Streptomyces]|uniref:SAM-dependent methyltransferase n=1 Tax=Streptomyces amritsarensis TaxID=681158 RepID=A0ABX3GBE2_9ACTN|nr:MULTISPECIES: class I SAM-dependent methyltransferase [Streptomyces]AQT74797.1 SAM-dependent methyltransferase [Streptomyces sp. fd1-xmd]MDX6759541.1 class I SAM-dependent methyltransferase [Streptomyces sp. F8]OLZ71754.1 SAM-dependent methyltransferase [Streptomyces amritsarensis]
MPFNHNDHYHDLLLRELPAAGRRALDIGCGNGKFAQKLALRGMAVDAVDADGDVIAAAREEAGALGLPAEIRFEQADITRMTLPPNTYDYISCLASIHHVPLETVERLREALTADGVLVILGCYRETTLPDHVVSALAVPVNAAYRLAVFAWEQRPAVRRNAPRRLPEAPVAAPRVSLAQIREYASTRLPRSDIRRLLFWRYLLVFRNGRGAGAR